MVRFGNQIRLAATDRERLRLLCDHTPPQAIQTVAAYNAFIDEQIARKSDATAEERLAKYLLTQLRQPADELITAPLEKMEQTDGSA